MRVAYAIGCIALAALCLAGYIVILIFAPGKEAAYLGAVELIALPLLAGFGGYITSQLSNITQQTNGNISSLIATIKEHTRMLAAASVPTEAIPSADGGTLAAPASAPPTAAPVQSP